jgi:hypothetical protein
MTFRSQPFIGLYNSVNPVAAVVDNPQGLVDNRVGTYAFGQAIYWNGTSIIVGGIPKFEPILADACN